jgi:hypothetical protein
VKKIIPGFALLGLIVYLIFVGTHPHVQHAWENFITAFTNLVSAHFNPGAKSL